MKSVWQAVKTVFERHNGVAVRRKMEVLRGAVREVVVSGGVLYGTEREWYFPTTDCLRRDVYRRRTA